MRRRSFVAGTALLAALLSAPPVPADSGPLRILRPVDLAALPLLVMERQHLVQRVADAMGLGEVAVNWSAPGDADPLAALKAGRADIAMVELAPFLIAADADSASPAAIRAVAAVVQRPYVLVTRNKIIRTIRDFGTADRIAVPELRVSGPALMLEMAAAQEWGPEHFDKLDRLAVARPDAAAEEVLLSGKGEIDSHFSRSPVVDDELGDPSVHRVMDSFDIAGPHSIAVLATTTRFAAAQPELTKAVLSALQTADDFIAKSRGAAAETFAAMSKSDIPVEELTDMLGDPDLAYRAAPAGVLHLAQFMHRIGRLKHPVRQWQDVFVAQAHDLPGR